MKARIVAAFVGLGILLPAVVYGGPTAVTVVVLLALGICMHEYARMAFPYDVGAAFSWLTVAGLVLLWGVHYGPAEHAAPSLAFALIGSFLFVVFRPGDDLSTAADKVGRYMLGIVWIAGLFGFLWRVRGLGTDAEGVAWAILALAIGWLGDTGAYFAGRSFGTTKLYPLISPKKTWAGVYGGVVTATAGVFFFRAMWLPTLTVVDCVVLGVLGCTAGVLGDLSESLVKRAFGVKDAGNLIPGHGGMLDRIDSVLFVAPVVYGYMYLLRGV